MVVLPSFKLRTYLINAQPQTSYMPRASIPTYVYIPEDKVVGHIDEFPVGKNRLTSWLKKVQSLGQKQPLGKHIYFLSTVGKKFYQTNSNWQISIKFKIRRTKYTIQ